MNRERFPKIALILLAFVFLVVSVCVTFTMAAHAGCCVQECDLCLGIAKIQESLRQFDGMSGALAGLLALLILLQFAAVELPGKQNIPSLVTLKTRLNN